MVTTMLLMVEMVLMVLHILHTGLNGLHNGVPTAAALPVASTKANQPITQMQAKNLYDAFYNDGLFDNSKGTMTIMADPAPTKWALGNDGQYTQITNGTTVLATATDGSVRQIILGFWFFCWSYNQW
jgi:hypothetical protein